ncbi:MAG: hypothetical protein ACREF3_15470 [Acetobacteraceae bacterium]
MTTKTAKIAMRGVTLTFAFGAATVPGATDIGVRGLADHAISIEPEAVRGQAQPRQLRSRGNVVS